MPIASATTAVHRDRLVLLSNAQWPEIQLLVSRGQIVSADPPLLMYTTQLQFYDTLVNNKNFFIRTVQSHDSHPCCQ